MLLHVRLLMIAVGAFRLILYSFMTVVIVLQYYDINIFIVPVKYLIYSCMYVKLYVFFSYRPNTYTFVL